MSSRDNKLWLQLWRDRHTDFHQLTENKFLVRFWSAFDLVPGSRVFVPLCGKSLDMIWLARQGHEVIGVELSPIAVKAFFRENGLHPSKQWLGRFTLWSCGRISILCGDYFSLGSSDLGHIDSVYDRAALTALPEDIRKHYVAHLHRIVPDTANVFMLTIEDAEQQSDPGAAPWVDAEITRLYAEHFDITLAHVESVLETDPARPDQPPVLTEYKVYRFISKSVNSCSDS